MEDESIAWCFNSRLNRESTERANYIGHYGSRADALQFTAQQREH